MVAEALISFPMYDWPEEQAAIQDFWAKLRDTSHKDAPDLALPDQYLSLVGDRLHDHWKSDNLLLSQSCWGPLTRGFGKYLLPIAQADYSSFEGGRGLHYRSVIVARDGKKEEVPETPAASAFDHLIAGKRLAFNDEMSLSGYLALVQDCSIPSDHLRVGATQTGSHRASLEAVRQGKADYAVIDCRSWALAQKHDDGSDELVVIGWTAERLGLPFVTSHKTPDNLKLLLQKRLYEMGCFPPPSSEPTLIYTPYLAPPS